MFVLCHGFHGNSFDVRNFKNTISIALPDALLLCSEANEEDSDQDISKMGRKLSQEIIKYIQENCPGSQLGRISFIGHSLGGIILRAAFPYLEQYKTKFHGFLTLCSPHLGCIYTQNKLVSAGMWFLKSIKKSQVLD
jgi:triacylglycerol esterase/lipase EstA (alpha/beta hydrolase family)